MWKQDRNARNPAGQSTGSGICRRWLTIHSCDWPSVMTMQTCAAVGRDLTICTSRMYSMAAPVLVDVPWRHLIACSLSSRSLELSYVLQEKPDQRGHLHWTFFWWILFSGSIFFTIWNSANIFANGNLNVMRSLKEDQRYLKQQAKQQLQQRSKRLRNWRDLREKERGVEEIHDERSCEEKLAITC